MTGARVMARPLGCHATVGGERRKLAPPEATILWLLMCRRYVTNAEIADALYPGFTVRPLCYRTNIPVYLSRLRKALVGSGWRVGRRGHGPLSLEREA